MIIILLLLMELKLPAESYMELSRLT